MWLGAAGLAVFKLPSHCSRFSLGTSRRTVALGLLLLWSEPTFFSSDWLFIMHLLRRANADAVVRVNVR